MSKITTIGLDLAKHVFHVVCCDEQGKVIRKNMLKRSQVLAYFATLPSCLVGMEACASAHHWASELGALGHQVKLIPPQYVKPYVRGNKNGYNDALAIAEAVTRPEMRFVTVKTTGKQDIQALHLSVACSPPMQNSENSRKPAQKPARRSSPYAP